MYLPENLRFVYLPENRDYGSDGSGVLNEYPTRKNCRRHYTRDSRASRSNQFRREHITSIINKNNYHALKPSVICCFTTEYHARFEIEYLLPPCSQSEEDASFHADFPLLLRLLLSKESGSVTSNKTRNVYHISSLIRLQFIG